MRTAEAELFKDKIEVSLDGRQIFYLFFGGAVIASLVFVLGVMVGKRLEARSHVASSAETSAALDPLAALDQLGAEERDQELAFPSALTGAQQPDALDAVVPAKAPEPEPVAAAKKVEQKPTPEEVAPPVPKPAPAVAATPAPTPAKAEPVAQPEPQAKPATAPDKTETAVAAKAEEAKTDEAPEAPPAPKPAAKPRAKFTLQLSSFQERGEAEAFHAKILSAGYKPYITEANVPGKGRWFRVRLGKYLTHQDALDAKSDFEKRQKIIAYVTRL